jgi:hypothetical protein
MIFQLFELLNNDSFLFLGDLDILPLSEPQLQDRHIALPADQIYQRPARVWHPLVVTVLQLLVTPDSTTHWNMRKEWILKGQLEDKVDLRLTSLLLSKYPKSAVTWAHRYAINSFLAIDCGFLKE